MTDFEKLADSWYRLRADGRLNCSFEWATTLFRYANYGICTTRDRPEPDARQTELDLKGGRVRRIATISVS